jgi:acetoin utilization deacetylase AcuC-like enzyme
MNRTGIVKDDRYLEHVMDVGHPESPERLRVIYKMLEEAEMKGLPEMVKPRAATREELEMIHAPAYIDLVASTAGKPYFRLDMDTSTCAKSAGGKDNITVVMCEVMQSQ